MWEAGREDAKRRLIIVFTPAQVACNAIEHDPNIQHMPMLAITSKIFRRARFWDSYHHK